ncbi:nitrate reductase molybdenum cofactor assembly chaperone [Hahella sp. CR1]|uniref:nitrate reductase molybdenum cofactor assembly chaperone n=1 Tax=Hahella sp. CR1 TaxID=2992807 RepID=UPI0024416010|nr:nitrate reductase molybdenum cofactor assembly chaperone [Hahella sp. CR1]MDG9670948.1 nitrate reductase molybdenum cofactor assembly chaperone [Hahella sp. CR1]
MVILKLISRLLDYPTEELYASSALVRGLVKDDQLLTTLTRRRLENFIDDFFSRDLLDLQSEYDGLFERGRAVSLHLFEHVHGESRDRGQAMVNLLQQYREAGLEISVRELPDYLPVYLEFAATQGEQARGWLQDVAHILALLAARLEERDSPYALLVHALIELAEVDVNLASLREQIKGEERDDTPEALDKIWEEEAVTFTQDSAMNSCGDARYRPAASQRKDDVMPVQLLDPAALAERQSNLG